MFNRNFSDKIVQTFSLKVLIKTFSILLPFILRKKKAYMVLLVLLFIDIAFTLAFAWFFGNLTDSAIHSNFLRLKWLIPIGIGLTLISIVSNFMGTYYETIASLGVKTDLQNHLYQHILKLPAEKTSRVSSGELLSHFSNDVHSVDGLIGSSLMDVIRLPLIFFAVFVYLFQINWILCLISLAIAPFAAFSSAFFGFLLRKNGRKIFTLYASITSHLNETFQGIQVIRSFTLEKIFFKRYRAKNEEVLSLELENAKLRGWFQSGGQLLSMMTYLVSLCLGAYFVSIHQMTVGALLTFINLVNHLVYPLTGLASQWAGIQRSLTAFERVLKVLDHPAATQRLSDYTIPHKTKKSIEIKDVTFRYDDESPLFERLNMNIPAGKMIAIVGPSGAGKTTLFNLLQGFYTPMSGEILFDSLPIIEMTLSKLRSTIALVPQETFLFAGTIRDNLLIARPEIEEQEMIQAAQNANIHEFICSLPEGYDTEIGERGVRLSGGQKQRIAIARAILKDAPVLLLDEATSAMDSETELLVKEALDQLMAGRTTIAIAHRLSTIQHADWIFVLDKGEIVQMGKHHDLIKMDGIYRNLYKVQFQSEAEPPVAVAFP